MTSIENFRRKFYSENDRSNAVLITSESNRFYFTRFFSSDGIVLITDEATYLIVDFRYYEMAKKAVSCEIEVVLANGKFSDAIKVLLKKHSLLNLWIEDLKMTVFEYNRWKQIFSEIKFHNLGGIISEHRLVKSKDEILFIKSAQKITDRAFEYILNYISKRETEKSVALKLEMFMRSNGASGIAFDTICVSGKNSSLPHGVPSDMPLSADSFITMDFGAKYNGYCSDMTRTVVLGNASEEMKKVYETVLEAQKAALAKIKAGVAGSAVDKAARDYIYKNGYEGCFGHSTGHGLGIDVHENGSFSPNYSKSIPKNSVLSVEPGIYLEGKFGVRIEDIVVVDENGYTNLTESPKNLIEIK